MVDFLADTLAKHLPAGAPYTVIYDGPLENRCGYLFDDANSKHGSILYKTLDVPSADYSKLPSNAQADVGGTLCGRTSWSPINGARVECKNGDGAQDVGLVIFNLTASDEQITPLLVDLYQGFWA